MFKSIRLLLLKLLGRFNYEKLLFMMKNGYWPDLSNPKRFNEIIAAMKIYQPITDLQILCSDKLKVRDYIADKIGKEYLTDLYQVMYDGEKLEPEKWPGKVVLKANHGSGKNFIRIIDNLSEFKINTLQHWANQAVKQDYGIITNELWYNYITPRVIIVEEKLNPNGNDLRDYKFLMVNNEIFFIQVDQGRFINHTRNLYTQDWEIFNFTMAYPKGPLVQEPKNLNLMINLAKTLSEEFKLCRVDFYEDEIGRVKFGEITFSPGAGWDKFKPLKYDHLIGKKFDKSLYL